MEKCNKLEKAWSKIRWSFPFTLWDQDSNQEQFLLHLPSWSWLVFLSYSSTPAAATSSLTLVMGKFVELDSPWPVFSSVDVPTGVPQGGGDEALLRRRLCSAALGGRAVLLKVNTFHEEVFAQSWAVCNDLCMGWWGSALLIVLELLTLTMWEQPVCVVWAAAPKAFQLQSCQAIFHFCIGSFSLSCLLLPLAMSELKTNSGPVGSADTWTLWTPGDGSPLLFLIVSPTRRQIISSLYLYSSQCKFWKTFPLTADLVFIYALPLVCLFKLCMDKEIFH